MRMRKKKHGLQRLEACSEFIITDKTAINNFPIHLEIGCGKGGFISQIAVDNPEIQYIAMEKIPDVLLLAAEKIRDKNIQNVKFIIGDAKNLIDVFSKGDVSRIYLNFSDPWPKSKHHKRRLTHENFLNIYKSILTDNGEIFFKTDNRDLFDFSLDEFKKCGFKLRDITYDLHNSPYNESNYPTEYEAVFSQKGFTINRAEAYL